MKPKRLIACLTLSAAVIASVFLLGSCNRVSNDPYENLENAIEKTFSAGDSELFSVVNEASLGGSIEVSGNIAQLLRLAGVDGSLPVSEMSIKLYNDSDDAYSVNRRQIDVALSDGSSASLSASMHVDIPASRLYLSSSALDNAYYLDFSEQSAEDITEDPYSQFLYGLSLGSEMNSIAERYTNTLMELIRKYTTTTRRVVEDEITVTFEMTNENLVLFMTDLFNTAKNDSELEELVNAYVEATDSHNMVFEEIFSDYELYLLEESITESAATGKIEAVISDERLKSISISLHEAEVGTVVMSGEFDENGSVSLSITLPTDERTTTIAVSYEVDIDGSSYHGKPTISVDNVNIELFDIYADTSEGTYTIEIPGSDLYTDISISGTYEIGRSSAQFSVDRVSAMYASTEIIEIDDTNFLIRFDSSAEVPEAPSNAVAVESLDEEFLTEIILQIYEDPYAASLLSLLMSDSTVTPEA